ncbi:MAG: beta galactosidase jelly roll domain-containing protein [Armatimonadetes bacterium]|nr:beta galactosidase jelly roll domain-containing protein [Armatimonadota bacterium]
MVLLLASSVFADIPRPEHPNPMAVRGEWMNLNGTWEFAETDGPLPSPPRNGEGVDQGFLTDKPYPDKIIVPFCRESKLSGLGRTGFVKNVWYRRTFDFPSTWKSPRVLLHIGACDYEITVWLNGQLLGKHRGGSSPITFEITRQLEKGTNTVIVHAFDDTRSGLQPTGKQAHSEQSAGCVYTRTTGIWQTVWLEGVGSTYIKDFTIETDPVFGRVIIRPEIDGWWADMGIKAVASIGDKVVGVDVVTAQWRSAHLTLKLSETHPWSPEKPFLYDLRLVITLNGRVVDEVKSYFGLRTVSILGTLIHINSPVVFQRLILDQGFYPDGIWTAPTDDALRHDIELSQACGFNGARLHQKVFEPRFLYWADKMGYLVWSEFPSWGVDYGNPLINLPFVNEWIEIVRRDRNHPAIVGWCPLNETSGAAGELQNTIIAATRAIDPSRPVIDTSGYVHSLAEPDVLDTHDYDQNPESFAARYGEGFAQNVVLPARYGGPESRASVPFMVSEFGGIGIYGAAPKDIDEFYTRYQGLVDALLDSPSQFGFCYTQLTDVEQETNGLYTYDRQPKFDVKRIHDITARPAFIETHSHWETAKLMKEPTADWRVVLGASPDGDLAKEWRYTFDEPTGDWNKAEFDDSAWKTGPGGFGSKGGWEWAIRTPWETPDIWLRQDFEYDGKPFDSAMLVAHYDNKTEVYINGKRVWHGTGWNDRYSGFNVMKAIKDVLRPGTNTVAVHTHQDGGGQFIDLALLLGGL